MARTHTKNGTALAPVEPEDVTDAMFAAVAAFLATNFPRCRSAALVVAPAPGMPSLILPVAEGDRVPACIGRDELPRID